MISATLEMIYAVTRFLTLDMIHAVTRFLQAVIRLILCFYLQVCILTGPLLTSSMHGFVIYSHPHASKIRTVLSIGPSSEERCYGKEREVDTAHHQVSYSQVDHEQIAGGPQTAVPAIIKQEDIMHTCWKIHHHQHQHQ
jgi:hypothetical protein